MRLSALSKPFTSRQRRACFMITIQCDLSTNALKSRRDEIFIANGCIFILKPIHGRQKHFGPSELGNYVDWRSYKYFATTWLKHALRGLDGRSSGRKLIWISDLKIVLPWSPPPAVALALPPHASWRVR